MRKTTNKPLPRLSRHETRIHLACMMGPDVEGSGYVLSLRPGAAERLGKRLGVTAEAVRQAWTRGATVAQVQDWKRRIGREVNPPWELTPDEVDEVIARHQKATARQDAMRTRAHPLDCDPIPHGRGRVTREDGEDAWMWWARFGPPIGDA